MLVTWRYRKRKSLIQSFDPRAWIIFYGCFMVSSVLFWDLRFLAPLLVIALVVVFTSGIKWREMYRAWLFIGGFIVFFSLLTFLTGRGGMELYTEEHLITSLSAPFTIFGWRPTLNITVERIFYALSQLVRVFSLTSMTILIPYSLNPAHYGITFHGLGLPARRAACPRIRDREAARWANRASAQTGPADRAGYHPGHRRQRGYHRRDGLACVWNRPTNVAGAVALPAARLRANSACGVTPHRLDDSITVWWLRAALGA